MTASSLSAVQQQPMESSPGPIYIDTQHEDLVHDSQMDYYGSKLATASSGKFRSFFVFASRDNIPFS